MLGLLGLKDVFVTFVDEKEKYLYISNEQHQNHTLAPVAER